MKKKFEKKLLISLICGDCDDSIAKKMEDNIIAHERWSIVSEMIFKVGDKYYRAIYSKGATEMQDEGIYEYAPEMIECEEVEQKEVTVTKYITKADSIEP